MLEAGSLWELVERRAEATPQATMTIDEPGDSITFGAYRDRAERAAAGLAQHGVGAGDVVSWQLPTWMDALVLVGALARLGAVQNPVLPIYREREMRFITRQAGTRLFVVPSQWRGFDFEALARGIAEQLDGLDVLVSDRGELPEGDPATLPPASSTVDGEEVRWLFYTSGTTSDPKGAKHTDRTIMATARGMCQRLATTPEDRNALAFPFTHIGGITWLFSSLMVGFVNLIDESFDPQRTTAFLAREGVTLAGSGTPFHQAYLKAQRENPDTPLFPGVRAFPGGGAPKPPQLHHEVKAELGGAGILSGYGLTEAPILTMSGVDDDDEALAHSEGKPMPGVDLRIVTVEGKPAGQGEEGEIRAKAPQLMKGYLDSSLDAEAFDEDGYFRTGDIGKQDADGNVIITGRLKDIIIRKGENISAKEVEDLLYGHPRVADVAVVGLPDPDSGERACAVVVPAEGGEPLTFEEMSEHLRAEGLMVQKIPEQLEIVDELPRNPSGKILKFKLRETYGS